jgi:hypothetical protein
MSPKEAGTTAALTHAKGRPHTQLVSRERASSARESRPGAAALPHIPAANDRAERLSEPQLDEGSPERKVELDAVVEHREPARARHSPGASCVANVSLHLIRVLISI